MSTKWSEKTHKKEFTISIRIILVKSIKVSFINFFFELVIYWLIIQSNWNKHLHDFLLDQNNLFSKRSKTKHTVTRDMLSWFYHKRSQNKYPQTLNCASQRKMIFRRILLSIYNRPRPQYPRIKHRRRRQT